MALGVEGKRAGRVLLRAFFLTCATFLFVFCLTLVYESMRSVMEIGGSCASGGPYVAAHPCPENVAWAMPLGIFGMVIAGGISLLSTFAEGGPRPYVFAWSAIFLALGWNFLDYGLHPPVGDLSWSWLVCGVIFVVMGGVPLILLFMRDARRWVFWGPTDTVVAGAGRAGTHKSPRDLVRMARTAQPATSPAAGPYTVLTSKRTADLDEEPTA